MDNFTFQGTDLENIIRALKRSGADPAYILNVYHSINSLFREREKESTKEKEKENIYNINTKTPSVGEKIKYTEPDSSYISGLLTNLEHQSLSIQKSVEDWVKIQDGTFTLSQCCKSLALTGPKDRHSVTVALSRLKGKLIEKQGNRSGEYRVIVREHDEIDWRNAPNDEFPIELPLRIDQLTKIYPGNIIILAGASNTGKTSFMLETVRLNMNRHRTTYMNSEMGPNELRERIELFGEILPQDKWNFTARERSSNFADIVDPDGLNVIDYMEVYKDFFEIGDWIRDIHQKLNNGVAVIAIQKKSSTKRERNDYGRGGELTLEKPRLYLAMDYGEVRIVKAKAWRNKDNNPNGLRRTFKLINGWKFLPTSEWQKEGSKYSDFVPEED